MSRNSSMVRKVRSYLIYRRSLGLKLNDQGRVLLRFAEFLDHSGHRGPLTTRSVLRWLKVGQNSQANRAAKLSTVRSFARYLAVRDGRTEVPDSRLVPMHIQRRRPHIYTSGELRQLLAAAGRMKLQCKLGPLTFRTLFGLLSSAGLRISEALNLTCEHVDLKRGILQIEHSKFKRSRLVPLHPTATRALRRYAMARDQHWGRYQEQPFFLNSYGRALTKLRVQVRFRELRDALGWHAGNGERPNPRIHDMRHSFACRRLLRWYRDGEDVHHRIAALSTYLGHTKVTYTYWYLTGTPELLAVIGSRFERFASRAGRRRS